LYPDPALHPRRRELWVRSYLQTYVQRDVRAIRNITNLRAFEQFVGLPPYHANFGKRLTRRAKLYFLDSALVCELTRLPSPEAALASPLGGPLFEGLVVTETLKQQAHRGLRPAVWFWRTRDGHEVDLLVPLGGRLLPVEVKLTSTPTTRHAATLTRFREVAGDACWDHGVLVCRVPDTARLPGGHIAMSLAAYSQWLDRALGEDQARGRA
jgi:uncharacterized protein